jgi:hypothetical protein
MKIGIVVISVLVVAQACARGEKAPSAPSPTPAAISENEMSPEFREWAHRASDAILRLSDSDTGIELRKLDAEKAVDEAKYRARTAKDKDFLEVLRAAEYLTARTKTPDVQNPDSILILRNAYQCKREIAAEFEPADSNDNPTEKTCLKQLTAIVKAWDERHKGK